MPPLLGNIIVIAVIAAAVFFAVRNVIRDFRSGGCAGCSGNCGCSSCSHCSGGSCSGWRNGQLSRKERKAIERYYKAYLKNKARAEKTQ